MTASLLAFGSCPWICENVARAACTLWSRGSWLGEPWFPHCAFVASRLTDYRMAPLCFVVSLLISVPYQSLRWYNVIISSSTFQMHVNWSADHRPCWFLLVFCFGILVCFVWFWAFVLLLFCFARWQLNGLWPIQFSSLLYAHCRHDWCCHCFNSVNLQNAIVFPVW